MNPYGDVRCPKCNDVMFQRVGRGWNNKVYFYCSCGEKLEV